MSAASGSALAPRRPVVVRAIAMVALLAPWLAGCGGGDGADTARPSAAAPRSRIQALAPGAVIPADAHLRGFWSMPQRWPLMPVHSVLLPDGSVLSQGTDGSGRQTGGFIHDLWDGAGRLDAGHGTPAPAASTELCCGPLLLLPRAGPASVLIAGADGGASATRPGATVYRRSSHTLTRQGSLNRPRWHATATTLINGDTYLQGGAGGNDVPELRGTDGCFRLLGIDTSALDVMHPRNFVAGDGRVFGYDGRGAMYYVNPATGAYTAAGQLAGGLAGSDTSAAMFRPGRILQFGGNANGAAVIDITGGGAPVVAPTATLPSQRRLVTGTILADGRVLATGGSSAGNPPTGANNIAEIWNPATAQWTQGASGAVARPQHANALLLPDATVLVAGGAAPGAQNPPQAEIYLPPYLFKADGQEAVRPTIAAAPAFLGIGKTFTLDIGGSHGISRVTLVKTGSVTHGWNMDQRFIELDFRENPDAVGNRLSVQAPARAGDAPPGYYMLFVFDAAGVPSVAKMVFLAIAANPDASVVPALVDPGLQSAAPRGRLPL